MSGSDSGDCFLMAFSSEGNLLWRNVYGGRGRDQFSDVIQANNGDIIACGLSGYRGTSLGAGSDIFLVRVRSSGETIWEKRYSVGENAEATSLLEDKNERIILTGTASFLCDSNSARICILVTESSGDSLWMKSYLDPYRSESNFIIRTLDNELIFGGSSKNVQFTSEDAYIVNTDIDGNFIWATRCGNDFPVFLYDGYTASTGDIYVTGRFQWSAHVRNSGNGVVG